MYIALAIVILFCLVVIIFMRQPKFGKHPAGKRLEKIKNSSNYKNGSFQNKSITPSLTDGATFYSVAKEIFFVKHPRVKPIDLIPTQKTDLLHLDINKDILIWFGHSSYYIQIDKKRILVDPVLSGNASPLSFTIKAFDGSTIYTADDIPEIDYLFITHDHWDHLDYKTVLKLKPKIKNIICGLGTGEHLEKWGYDTNIIFEKDWDEELTLGDGFTVHTISGRHFSGRTFTRNKSLWLSFVLKTPTMQLFIGGDSGYDSHFAETGKKFGIFDLVILENGQYNKSWKHIHMMPAEVLQAAKEMNAKRLFPVHSSKFALAIHPWDEPLTKITELNKKENVSLITPLIGEQVNLKDDTQKFTEWWKNIN